MRLDAPIWLLLALPSGAALLVWRARSRLEQSLRAAISLLVILALASPRVSLPERAGTAVLVVDRSASMPAGSDASAKEAVDLLRRARPASGRLAVVSFGERAAVEVPPGPGALDRFAVDVGRDGSDLADALAKALSLVPRGAPGRLLVVSDGLHTGADPARAGVEAASRGIAVDFRLLRRPPADDLAVERFDGPSSAAPGEGFLVTGWVRSPVEQEISFELARGATVLAASRRRVPAGLTPLTFRDTAGAPGTQAYRLSVSGEGRDPMPENNSARLLVGVRGPKPILLASLGTGALASLLRKGGVNVVDARFPVPSPDLPSRIHRAPADGLDFSLEELSRYAAVILEDYPAEKPGRAGLASLASWITDAGGGLLMTGGRRSYGPGGYFKSPLEPVLPVSMELRQEHRKFSLAMVVAMDRSGSMAVPAGGGRTKMDLADLGAVGVLDLLSPMDEFGAIAIDSSPHIVAPLARVSDKEPVKSELLRVASMGGGIFIYEALASAAEMMLKATAGTKHILLFADAADSEEPGDYKELLKKCREAEITVSVIGLGTPSDPDAELLRDIARRGGGDAYFSANPDELPALFAQDTFVVARSAFVDGPAPWALTPGLHAVTSRAFDAPPALGGYNLCYLRDRANLAAVTTDHVAAPVIATWQAGAGRVAAYTGEASGKSTGAVAGWSGSGELFSSLARWTAGTGAESGGGLLARQSLDGGLLTVELDLDLDADAAAPGGGLPPFTGVPRVTVLKGHAGSSPSTVKAPLEWTSADRLSARVPLGGGDTAIASVEIPGGPRLVLPAIAPPYSAEYRSGEGERGVETLVRLARATGGVERVSLPALWNDMPRDSRSVELAPWLLLVCVPLLLAEVLERRTALVSTGAAALRRRVLRERMAEARTPVPESSPAPEKRVPSPDATPRPRPALDTPGIVEAQPAAGVAPAAPPAQPVSIVEAMRRARERVRGLDAGEDEEGRRE